MLITVRVLYGISRVFIFFSGLIDDDSVLQLCIVSFVSTELCGGTLVSFTVYHTPLTVSVFEPVLEPEPVPESQLWHNTIYQRAVLGASDIGFIGRTKRLLILLFLLLVGMFFADSVRTVLLFPELTNNSNTSHLYGFGC